MSIPEAFKYDVRVRERLLRRGLLNEADLNKHMDALPDAADKFLELDLKQPALLRESERDQRPSRPAPARPIAAPIRSVDDLSGGNDLDEDSGAPDLLDEEDDEDEDEDEAGSDDEGWGDDK